MLDQFIDELSATGDLALHVPGAVLVPDIAVGSHDAQPGTVVKWQVGGKRACRFQISPTLRNPERISFMARRMRGIWPLLEAFYAAGAPGRGRVNINLEDHTVRPGLSFCGNDEDSFLVPDAIFIARRGYAETRAQLEAGGPDWTTRRKLAVWRGATTGIGRGNWRVLPRTHLCQLSNAHPELLDAGMTHVVQMPPEAEGEIRAAGLMRAPIAVHDFAGWRYQIDIDGNTNSWPGLFQKLLTGSPVVKVASLLGWRQWYYDRLTPWVHFVPAAAGLGDLVEKIDWLREHDAEARAIGQAGRALALSMTYEAEIRGAVPVMVAGFKAAAVRRQAGRT